MARKRRTRPNGEGTLEKRGRTWRARWTVGGKTYTRSTGTGDRREAAKRLAEFTAPFRLGSERETLEGLAAKVRGVQAEMDAIENARPALPLSEGFEAYRRSGERPDTGAATLDMYECQYRRLVRWMAERHPEASEMRHVTREMAAGFMADLAANLSANTYNKYATLFRRMWDVLAETARTEQNPWRKIAHRAEGGAATRRELTVDELRRVCGRAQGEMRALVAVGIYTGLRLGDCALLEWGSVDLARRMISVTPRKTARHAKGRTVAIPVHPALAEVLSETPPAERTGHVIPETAAAYLSDRTAVTNRVQALFASCGIRTTRRAQGAARASVEVGFHSLRHTFVSMAANAGAPLALIQSIVGHSSPAMTRHYFHESGNALKSAVGTLPDVTAGSGRAGGADAPDALPRAFLDALDGMGRGQLEAARAEIDRRLK